MKQANLYFAFDVTQEYEEREKPGEEKKGEEEKKEEEGSEEEEGGDMYFPAAMPIAKKKVFVLGYFSGSYVGSSLSNLQEYNNNTYGPAFRHTYKNLGLGLRGLK